MTDTKEAKSLLGDMSAPTPTVSFAVKPVADPDLEAAIAGLSSDYTAVDTLSGIPTVIESVKDRIRLHLVSPSRKGQWAANGFVPVKGALVKLVANYQSLEQTADGTLRHAELEVWCDMVEHRAKFSEHVNHLAAARIADEVAKSKDEINQELAPLQGQSEDGVTKLDKLDVQIDSSMGAFT